MDRERKTLAEYSRAYLRSLETPAIVYNEGDRNSFAEHVASGMKKATLQLVSDEPPLKTRRVAFDISPP